MKWNFEIIRFDYMKFFFSLSLFYFYLHQTIKFLLTTNQLQKIFEIRERMIHSKFTQNKESEQAFIDCIDNVLSLPPSNQCMCLCCLLFVFCFCLWFFNLKKKFFSFQKWPNHSVNVHSMVGPVSMILQLVKYHIFLVQILYMDSIHKVCCCCCFFKFWFLLLIITIT